MSIVTSKVLNDVGASKDTVMERRETFLERECIHDLSPKLLGFNVKCFHFGSQSEGATIPGLQPDTDYIYSYCDMNIMRVWGDWVAWVWSFLMLQDDITPPQQYLLQVISTETPEPVISLCGVM
ncbi:hypothetical protein DPMN_099543 [Dreissena polymorpha]|uniref:Uncharacterized protein n=1 Tax=Dreissena polymorpha TaxID=45954 RepID=A0A9D4LGL4_DREPO|nr:hypothetical protein DPMN_099543 [Dreissena polymorpha]